MKKLLYLLLCLLFLTPQITFGNNVNSLIAAVIEKYGESGGYWQIQIGSTSYLIKGKNPKILKKKKISPLGGICGKYATVRLVGSDRQMRENTEGEAAIWKFSNNKWKEFVPTGGGGVWSCNDLKSIPKTVQKCLDVDECY